MVKGAIERRDRHNSQWSQLTNFCRRGGGNVGIKINKLGFLHQEEKEGEFCIANNYCVISLKDFFYLPNVKLKMFVSFMLDKYFLFNLIYVAYLRKIKEK